MSSVRVPETLSSNSNPTDTDVIESICYSRLAEPYMIDNFKKGDGMYLPPEEAIYLPGIFFRITYF